MPRFVILQHAPEPGTTQKLHWDLMLEESHSLRTWALSDEPSSGSLIAATQLPDHRKLYLDYEGAVSGNRGHVRRWDQGEYQVLLQADRQITLQLNGQKFRAIATLTRAAESETWSIVFDRTP